MSTPGLAENTFVSRHSLSCCRLSSCRVVELVGPPTAFPRTGLRVPWVSCLDTLGFHRVQDDPVTKSQPLCVLVGIVTSCVLCARFRDRVSSSCATGNTYTPTRLEALFKLSIVTIFRHLYRVFLVGALSNSSSCSKFYLVEDIIENVLACCQQCRNPSCSRKCKSFYFSED